MSKGGVKRVLLLGTGYVSEPIVEYLTRNDKTQVTAGKFVLCFLLFKFACGDSFFLFTSHSALY